jgi:hypothetical protein
MQPSRQPSSKPTRQPSIQPSSQPSSKPSRQLLSKPSIVITTKPTIATEKLFSTNVNVQLTGITEADITDTIKLSLREATAILLSVSLDSVSEPSFTPILIRDSTRLKRKLVSGFTVTFVVVFPSVSAVVAQKDIESKFQTSGNTYATLVTQIAKTNGATTIPPIQYIGSTVAVDKIPTTQPTILENKTNDTAMPAYEIAIIVVFSSLGGFVLLFYVYKYVKFLQLKEKFVNY